MKNVKDYRRTWSGILWGTGMLILILLAVMWYWVISYDTNEQVSDSSNQGQPVYFMEHDFNEATDSWETSIRTSDSPEDYEAYIGTTCSCKIINTNNHDVKDWNLRLNINQECYLNAFWCGSFEVHQFRDGNELINSIENQMVDISGMDIDRNIYSDTTLIHLLPGDYLVYTPSVSANEDLVSAESEVGIGFIFYYQDALDLSDWSLTYYNDLKLLNLIVFKLVLVAILLWTIALIVYLIIGVMTRKMRNQMNSRIKNISIMADLYLEAYIIDLKENTAQLIKGDEKNLVWNLTGDNVQEKINERLNSLDKELFYDELSEFLNLSTIGERMNGLLSISTEYVEEKQGWCSIRIFSTGEDTGNRQLVFTLQDINEEKKKLREIEDRINLAEYKQNVSGSFLETVSFALNNISSMISTDGKQVLADSSEEEIKTLADRIVMNTRHMNLIQNTMIDLYTLENKTFTLNVHPYNIYDMLAEVNHILEPFPVGKPFEYSFEVDNSVPAMLIGDSDRLEQMLVILIFSSMLMTQQGFVKFSLFGKQHGDEEELIFSMRDSARGFTEQELQDIYDFINGANIETFDNASLVYHKIINGILSHMDSKLKIVSVVNEGTDFFFTVTQKIAE